MKNLYLLFKPITVGLLFFIVNSCVTDHDEPIHSLKIATLNCKFLWDGIEPEEGNPLVTFQHKGNPELAREHMEKISKTIHEINADIINLVEVEGYDALKLLNDSFLQDLGYNIGFVKGKDTYTGEDVALLSKLPLDSIWRFDEKGSSGTVEKSVSKNYCASVQVNQIKFAVIGLHFLARPLDVSRIDERQAQADAIHGLSLIMKNKGYQLIIMGDFNDYDGDTNCLDVNNNKPVTSVLSWVKELNPNTENDNLVNVCTFLQKSERYTNHWDQDDEHDVDETEKSSIDHILVTPGLINSQTKAQILHNYNPLEVTDHFPVIAELFF